MFTVIAVVLKHWKLILVGLVAAFVISLILANAALQIELSAAKADLKEAKQQLASAELELRTKQQLILKQNAAVERYEARTLAFQQYMSSLPTQLEKLNSSFNTALVTLKKTKPVPEDCKGAMQWLRDNAQTTTGG